jgi:hypothetical protein
MSDEREVCLLIGAGDAVLWADTSGSTAAMADSRVRWDAIWARRDELVEIAHSHPHGPLAFSAEDETTMAALRAALGRPLRFSVVAPRGMILRDGDSNVIVDDGDEPWWADVLRALSRMQGGDTDVDD